MRAPTACLLLAVVLLRPTGLQAKDANPPEGELPEIAGVRVGFAGRYKVGLWTPVEVTLRGGSKPISGELSLTVPDGDGVPSRVATPLDQPCEVLPGRDTRVLLYARFGRIQSDLIVALRHTEGRLLAREQFTAAETSGRTDFLPAVAATQKMIVAVGADSLGVEKAIGLLGQSAGQQAVVVRLEDGGQLPGRQLPDRWYGYEGVHTLVLSTARPEMFKDLTPGCPRIEALNRWIWMGGRLVICVGSQAGEFHGGNGLLAPLAPFLPGRFEMETEDIETEDIETRDAAEKVRIFPLRQTGALEIYCATSVPVPSQGADDVPWVPKLTDVDQHGTIEAQEADLPLVIRTPRGFGRIVFFAGDLDRQPLNRWGGRPELIGRLLDLPAAETQRSGERAAVMHYGYNDLAGQLRSALDQFPDVWPVPFGVVCVLIVIYILLIGPGDYFFLRKVVRRMEWTWLSFPLIVLVFAVGAYLAAYRLKGDEVRINQVDLVDVDVATDPQSGFVRGTSWINTYSPRASAFNLTLQPNLPDGTVPQDARVTLSWLGLPGKALGGMNSQASNPLLWAEPYDFSPQLDSIRNMPIQIWSTKSLTARWTAQTRGYPQADLTEEGRAAVGTITNTLGFPLSHCVLIYGSHAYTLETLDNRDDRTRLGTLQAGESTTIDAWTLQHELKTLLTGRKLKKLRDSHRLVSTPYKQSSVDLPYILQAMMFFDAAGGRGYTGLGNGYQDFVDLTHVAETNRAILLAQGPDAPDQPGHGAQWLCKDRNRRPIAVEMGKHVTIYRFVFPVKKGTPE